MKIEHSVFTREKFPELLNTMGYLAGAEIGVQGGDHAVHLLTGWRGFLYLVDSWCKYDAQMYRDMANVTDSDHGIHYARCVEQMIQFHDRTKIIRAFSVDAAKDIADKELDFVYIDANHTYKSVMQDLEAWTPKVRLGGMISGHDYTKDGGKHGEVFGVKPAVDDFFADREGSIFVSEEEWPTWYLIKDW